MICGLRDVGAMPTMLSAETTALAATAAALSSMLLVNRLAAFRCTVELQSANQVLPRSSSTCGRLSSPRELPALKSSRRVCDWLLLELTTPEYT
jgi:hypothetical protein